MRQCYCVTKYIIIFRKGYDGVFIKRKHLDYDEGEATFYRTKRFTCIKSQGYSTQDLIEKVRP